MARIELDVEHTLPQPDALARVKVLGAYYRDHHGATVTWNDAVGTIEARYLAIRLHALVRVEATRVHCEAPDPGFLLRRRGTEYLRKKIQRYLDPATPIELLPGFVATHR